MKRETPEQLQARMKFAMDRVPQGQIIRHARTGGEYMVRGHALRAGDLFPMVNYSPVTGPVVVFCRTITDIQAKFVFADGRDWISDNEGG